MKKLYKGFIMALSMFTILPTPYVEWDDDGVKNMMKFLPTDWINNWNLVEYNILFSEYIKYLNNFKEFNNYHSTIYNNRNAAFRWFYGCLRCNSFKEK